MEIKRNLKQSLIWWMISWENSTAFCLFKPSPLDWNRHTKTHFQVPRFLCRSSEVRKIWCYQFPQIQSRHRSTEPNLKVLGFLNSPFRSLCFRKSWCAESIELLLCPFDKKNSLKHFHHNNNAHCGTDNAFFNKTIILGVIGEVTLLRGNTSLNECPRGNDFVRKQWKLCNNYFLMTKANIYIIISFLCF